MDSFKNLLFPSSETTEKSVISKFLFLETSISTHTDGTCAALCFLYSAAAQMFKCHFYAQEKGVCYLGSYSYTSGSSTTISDTPTIYFNESEIICSLKALIFEVIS